MEYLKGVVVRIKAGSAKFAGTDDPLYLGVSGTAGGREFPLDVERFDDHERRSEIKYALGTVWDGSALAGARHPVMAEADWNDPRISYVGFDGIDRVYLRKQAGRREDDAYQLDEIEVLLFGDEPHKRRFRCTTAYWLGIEYGLKVWVPEVQAGSVS